MAHMFFFNIPTLNILLYALIFKIEMTYRTFNIFNNADHKYWLNKSSGQV